MVASYDAAVGWLDRFRQRREGRSTDGATSSGPVAVASPPEDVQHLFELARSAATLEEQTDALAAYLRGRGISDDGVRTIVAETLPGVALFEEGDASQRSRLGGAGLLPAGESWPRDPDGHPMTFIAAIDFSEMPTLEPLPSEGVLLIYWDHNYFELERMDFVTATRVFYCEPGLDLTWHTPPESSPAFGPTPLRGFIMPIAGEARDLEVPEADEDPIYEAFDSLLVAHAHQLLGRSRDVQGPVLGEVAYWFDTGYPETRARYNAAELAGAGWTLLAQFDETDDGLTFGDAGALYLVIPEADLQAQRFDRVMGIMQCA